MSATSGLVDLRSDTITQPTPAMRRAMASAKVGDDVFGDDPTVSQLEAETAQWLGKEAAVFVPSGTMANQVAVRAHTEPGDEILVEANAHIYYYESGAPAALSGVMCRPLPGQRGVFSGADLEAALRPEDPHFPRPRLVCVENTHNRGGGSVWPLKAAAEVAAVARQHRLRLHLDGARLWNASIATGTPERHYASLFDSVSVCFSKGLGAPAGSILAGPNELIQRARRFRKMFGGAMRQTGILAAAALYALRHHRERLAEDHAHAQLLARELTGCPGLEVNPAEVETNMVRFTVLPMPAARFADVLRRLGVLVLAVDKQVIRAVTSLMVGRQEVLRAARVIRRLLRTK